MPRKTNSSEYQKQSSYVNMASYLAHFGRKKASEQYQANVTVLLLIPKLVCFDVIQIFLHETEFYAHFDGKQSIFSYTYVPCKRLRDPSHCWLSSSFSVTETPLSSVHLVVSKASFQHSHVCKKTQPFQPPHKMTKLIFLSVKDPV